MMQIQILLVVAATAIAGCKAQEGPPVTVQPGLPPVALADIVVVETGSANNSIAALVNDIDLSGTGLTITTVTVDQTLPPAGASAVSTNGTTVTFTAAADGGAAPYQFRWLVFSKNSWKVSQGWSSSNTFSWRPVKRDAGYRVRVEARSATGEIVTAMLPFGIN